MLHTKTKKHKKFRAFTLIEMVVVVAITSVLAASSVPILVGSIWRTRDATRKYDITQLSQSLNAFYADNGRYPNHSANSEAGGWEVSIDTGWLQSLQGRYMAKTPVDPLNVYTRLYPWAELQRWSDYMYVYASFQSWYIRDPLYVCNLDNYVIIGAANFENTAPGMWPACPWYDRSTLVDFGFVLSRWNTYMEYKSIAVNTGSNTNTWTYTNTGTETSSGSTNSWSTSSGSTSSWSTNTWTNTGWWGEYDDDDDDDNDDHHHHLPACPNTLASATIWSRQSCYCPEWWINGNSNIRWTNEYTSNSSVCTAARHAGMIKKEWGNVTVLITPGRSSYIWSLQNGISSKTKKNGSNSWFRFYTYEF